MNNSVEMRNCPFEGLVPDHGDLVCAMSLALVEGIVEAAGPEGVAAVLDPRPGWCCVRLAERAAERAQPAPQAPRVPTAVEPSPEDRRRDGWRSW